MKGGVVKMAGTACEVSMRPVPGNDTSWVSRNVYEVVMRTLGGMKACVVTGWDCRVEVMLWTWS